MRIKCLWYSQNACIFKFHYFGEGTSHQAPPANFSKVNFNYKTQKITIHVNAYPKCTKKYIEVNEWALRVAGTSGSQTGEWALVQEEQMGPLLTAGKISLNR